ncbi:hypothetical protein J3A83DRAFT_326127 [Scleroderma citrinum]
MHSPQTTAPASGGTSALIKGKVAFKRIRNQIFPRTVTEEATSHVEPTGSGHESGQRQDEGSPHPGEPFSVSPTASGGNERSSALFQQPTPAVLENVEAIVPRPSTVVTGPNETMGEHTGLATATHEVSGDAQPAQTAVKDIEDAEKKISTIKTIPGPVGSAVNAIGFADTAMTHLNTTNATYLRPISAFNAVVSGIANIHPYAQMALTVLTTASNVHTYLPTGIY